MFRNSSVPGLLITAIAAIAMAAGVFVLLVTATTPWLGLHLTPRGEAVVLDRSYLDFPMGTVVEAIGLSGETPRPIVALDILAEPDSLPTYAAMQEFYDRQSQLAVLLTAPELEVHLRDALGTTALALVMPDNRPLWSMPGSFWVQVLTGVASLLISGWVWALRPGQLAPGLFALSGLGTLIVTLTSAYYAHRGLALSGDVFAALTAVNHLGIFLFAGSLCGLFLIYPRPLLRRRWLPVLPALLIPLLILDTLHVGIEAEHYYVIVVGVTVAILLLIVAQWWATRSHPDERAALGWLGLSVAIAIASFSFLALAPGLLGLDNPLSQHYGAGAIVLIYVGLALGLRRYRPTLPRCPPHRRAQSRFHLGAGHLHAGGGPPLPASARLDLAAHPGAEGSRAARGLRRRHGRRLCPEPRRQRRALAAAPEKTLRSARHGRPCKRATPSGYRRRWPGHDPAPGRRCASLAPAFPLCRTRPVPACPSCPRRNTGEPN